MMAALTVLNSWRVLPTAIGICVASRQNFVSLGLPQGPGQAALGGGLELIREFSIVAWNNC
jgi:hypothetical protein